MALTNVNVVPMDEERVLEGQTVVVRDGMITDVDSGSSVSVPPDALRIDGGGGYLLPGLTDAHVHLRNTSELLSDLAYGVTTVFHLSGPAGNIPDVLALRRQVANGAELGPTIYTAPLSSESISCYLPERPSTASGETVVALTM